jgi:hypothetical protein
MKIIGNYFKAFYKVLGDNELSIKNLHPQYFLDNLSTIQFGSKSSANIKIRDEYNNKVNQLVIKYSNVFLEYHKNDQCFSQEIAIQVSNERDAIKHEMQAQSPFISRFFIYSRNLDKYNNAEGPSKEDKQLQLDENPEIFAYKALKTGGGDLGLSNNGFDQHYNSWEENNFNGSYPEELLLGAITNDVSETSC